MSPVAIEGSCTFFADPRWPTVGSSWVSPRAPRQQLILARLPPYIDVRYSVLLLGTFGHSSTFAGGVREQRLGFFFCIGSIGACENRKFSP